MALTYSSWRGWALAFFSLCALTCVSNGQDIALRATIVHFDESWEIEWRSSTYQNIHLNLEVCEKGMPFVKLSIFSELEGPVIEYMGSKAMEGLSAEPHFVMYVRRRKGFFKRYWPYKVVKGKRSGKPIAAEMDLPGCKIYIDGVTMLHQKKLFKSHVNMRGRTPDRTTKKRLGLQLSYKLDARDNFIVGKSVTVTPDTFAYEVEVKQRAQILLLGEHGSIPIRLGPCWGSNQYVKLSCASKVSCHKQVVEYLTVEEALQSRFINVVEVVEYFHYDNRDARESYCKIIVEADKFAVRKAVSIEDKRKVIRLYVDSLGKAPMIPGIGFAFKVNEYRQMTEVLRIFYRYGNIIEGVFQAEASQYINLDYSNMDRDDFRIVCRNNCDRPMVSRTKANNQVIAVAGFKKGAKNTFLGTILVVIKPDYQPTDFRAFYKIVVPRNYIAVEDGLKTVATFRTPVSGEYRAFQLHFEKNDIVSEGSFSSLARERGPA